MRQVGLLPSGCQAAAQNSVLFCSDEQIIYASSLSVYIINAQTFLVEKILSCSQKAITSISVSNVNKQLLAMGTADGNVNVWNIETEEIISRASVNCGVSVAWDNFSTDYCGLLAADKVCLYLWDTNRSVGGVVEAFNVRNASLVPKIMRWNPSVKGWVAIGCNGGYTFLFKNQDKSHQTIRRPENTEFVTDVQWDRLSSSYLLIAFQTMIELWDCERLAIIHAFEKQPIHIQGIAWMEWTAGNFVSINERNRNLKVWNASQQHPLETIRIKGDGGLNAVTIAQGRKLVLCSCTDGSTFLYDMVNKSIIFKTPANHTETIFCCKYSPVSPHIFATGSYDGTVKIWMLNTPNFTLQRTLIGPEGTIYCISWSPDGTMIGACYATGLVIIWDTDNGLEIARILNHTKASYFICWNPHDERYILTSSADNAAIVSELDIEKLKDPQRSNIMTHSRKKGVEGHIESLTNAKNKFIFNHPAPVFGCAWSPTDSTIFVTCCQDSVVRIFNYVSNGGVMFNLRGHGARVFSCEWSPLVPGMLATGADDQSIIIWNVDVNRAKTGVSPATPAASVITPTKQLTGHASNVRALCWNHEFKNLILSGSWDSTIRLWDIISGCCLYQNYDHVSDVYAIISHPQRPFSYISCSRDATIRMWELDQGFMNVIRYYAIWDASFERVVQLENEKSVVQTTYENNLAGERSRMIANLPKSLQLLLTNMQYALCGKESKSLLENQSLNIFMDDKDNANNNGIRRYNHEKKLSQQETKALIEKYYNYYTFFNGYTGYMDVWELIMIIQNQKQAIKSSFFQTLTINNSNNLLRPNSLRHILHENEILGQAKMNARNLQLNKTSAVSIPLKKQEKQTEESLMQIALSCVRIGEFQKYCEIMIELNKWEAALAVAPSVSIDYWKHLMQQHAVVLRDVSHSEACVPYFLSIGKDMDAIQYYLQYNHNPITNDNYAFIIAKMSEQRIDLIPDYSLSTAGSVNTETTTAVTESGNGLLASLHNHYSNSSNNNSYSTTQNSPMPRQSHLIHSISASNIDLNWASGIDNTSPSNSRGKVRERTENEIDNARNLVRSIAIQSSNSYAQIGQPILSAAQMLAIDDIQLTIDLLLNHYEFDLAYAIAICFQVDLSITANILLQWADRCFTWGIYPLALEMLQNLPNTGNSAFYTNEMEIFLLLSKHCDSLSQMEDLLKESNYGKKVKLQSYLNTAREEEAIGSDFDAVASYIIAKEYEKAAVIGMNCFKRIVRDPFECNANNNYRRLLRIIKNIRAKDIPDSSVKMQFLCYMLWFCAHEAALKGLMSIAGQMLNILLDYTNKLSTTFPVTDADIQYQMLFFMLFAGDNNGPSVLSTLLANDGHVPGAVSDSLRALSALLNVKEAGNNTAFNNPNSGWRIWTRFLSSGQNSLLRSGGAELNLVTSVVREICKLSEALSLPSLSNANSKKSKMSGPEFILELIVQHKSAALMGSLFPVANQQFKPSLFSSPAVSCINLKPIQQGTTAFELEDHTSFVSKNEAANWRRCNPYSPLMNGEFLHF